MVVEGMQAVIVGLDSISPWSDVLAGVSNHFQLAELSSHLQVDWNVLAQTISDANLLGQIASAWNKFIKTGQVWALLIGIAIGYLFRSMTSF
ncbi:MAG TPA: hypothetical protein V6D14_35510 [Coleofasciculaceae cyanobacterium]|jgi:hypothetical protein